MSDITRINDLPVRPPEAGRIRLGEKTEKGWPSSIDVFRFTSPHKVVLDQLAKQYGGVVEKWNEPKANAGQWQLRTTSSTIRIMVREDGLNMQYELWTGGGRSRSCDGEFATVPQSGPEPSMVEVPCICRAKGVKECKMKLRMTVFLPDVDFYGVWRVETSSENAAIELPGMFDAITQLAEAGRMVRAFLNLEQRTSMVDGKKKNYVVPTISIGATPDQMLGGMSVVRPSLDAQPEMTAIDAGGSRYETPDPTDESPRETANEQEDVIEAQIVDPDRELELEAAVRTVADNHGQNGDLVVAKLWEMSHGDYDKIESFVGKDDGSRSLGWAQNGNLKWTRSE